MKIAGKNSKNLKSFCYSNINNIKIKCKIDPIYLSLPIIFLGNINIINKYEIKRKKKYENTRRRQKDRVCIPLSCFIKQYSDKCSK